MALGKGLASLIPKQNMENAEEMLERIDSMEFVNEETAAPKEGPPHKPVGKKRIAKTVSIVEDFDELDDDEELAPPAKPLVTPISIDPDDAPVQDTRASVKNVPVEEEPEDEEAERAPRVAQAVSPAPEPAPAPDELPESREHNKWDRHEATIIQIPIGDVIINPHQPRRSFDEQEMEELAQSMDRHGMLQPLVVQRLADGSYELIAGERRLRAAKKLKWDKIPCVVRREVATDQSRLVLALIENIQRRNLNAIEEAAAYKELHQQYGLTHEEIGQRVGKSRVSITNLLRVLLLPAEVQRGLMGGRISTGHAKAILMIPDEDKQIRFYNHILGEGLTVRSAETRARRIQRTMHLNDGLRDKSRRRHPFAVKYAPALEKRYGYDADIKFESGRSRYHITFRVYKDEEVEELIGRLLGTKPLALELDQDVIDEGEEESEE